MYYKPMVDLPYTSYEQGGAYNANFAYEYNIILVHAKALWGEPARMQYMYTAQVKCMLGSEVDAIMGVVKCRRVGVYGRYCGCASS